MQHLSIPEIEAQEAEWKADAILRAAWDISASTLMDSLPRMEISYQPLIRKSEAAGPVTSRENPNLGKSYSSTTWILSHTTSETPWSD